MAFFRGSTETPEELLEAYRQKIIECKQNFSLDTLTEKSFYHVISKIFNLLASSEMPFLKTQEFLHFYIIEQGCKFAIHNAPILEEALAKCATESSQYNCDVFGEFSKALEDSESLC